MRVSGWRFGRVCDNKLEIHIRELEKMEGLVKVAIGSTEGNIHYVFAVFKLPCRCWSCLLYRWKPHLWGLTEKLYDYSFIWDGTVQS